VWRTCSRLALGAAYSVLVVRPRRRLDDIVLIKQWLVRLSLNEAVPLLADISNNGTIAVSGGSEPRH